MLETFREWIMEHQRLSFFVALGFLGAFSLVLASGIFNVEIGQFFAAQCLSDNDCAADQFCDGTCRDGVLTDESCSPVTPTDWNSGLNPQCTPFPQPSPTPPPLPENFLPHIALSGGKPAQAPYDCFGFSLEGDWESVNARQGGDAVSGADGIVVVRGTVFNNCPWPVELTGGAAGSPKQGSDFIFREDGSIDHPWTGVEEIYQRVMPTERIPSCWNYPHLSGSAGTVPGGGGGGENGGPPAVFRAIDFWRYLFGTHAWAQALTGPQSGCMIPYEATVDASAFNCGRVEVSMGWRHHDQRLAEGFYNQDGYNVVLNYGRDCTGAPGERAPSSGAGGTGTSGISGAGPAGSFNCGTGPNSNACWCGEWTDALWAQRHMIAACNCDPGFIINESYSATPGALGKTCGDFRAWSDTVVQEFMDIMAENFDQSCTPRPTGVDYMGIQEKYFAIYDYGKWGLGGNGTSAVAALCRDSSGTEAAVLNASCTNGRTPVVLTWNVPTNSVANALIRRVDGGEGQFLSGIGRLQTNYTDTDAQGAATYAYQHKSHPSVVSNTARVILDAAGACSVQESSSPTPTLTGAASPTPVSTLIVGTATPLLTANPSSTVSPIPTVSITPPPPPATGCGDFDHDGICDDDECPTASQGYCRDSDGDGTPDFADPSAGIGDAGVVSTGPAEAGFLAFALASVAALLYVSYTHTAPFRKKEITSFSSDRDHMDFQA